MVLLKSNYSFKKFVIKFIVCLVISSCNITDDEIKNNIEDSNNSIKPIELFAVGGNGDSAILGEKGRLCIVNSDKSWLDITSGDPSLKSITYGNKIFVAVGDYGRIMTSNNGRNWIQRSYRGNNLNSIIYADGKFIGVGDGSTYVYSDNGISWKKGHMTNFYADYTDICWGNNTFVAIGDRNRVMTSTDGKEWDSNQVENSFNSVAFGNGKFIAVGYSGQNATSADGVNWNINPLKATEFQTLSYVKYNGVQFIAAGQNGVIVTSDDGISWELKKNIFTSDIMYLYSNSDIDIAGDKWGNIKTSNDKGATWSNLSHFKFKINAISYGSGKYIAIGDSGNYAVSDITCNNWERFSLKTDKVSKVASNIKDTLVAVGPNGLIKSSNDGIKWDYHTFNTEATYTDVTYGNNMFVIAESNGQILTMTAHSWEINKISVPSVGNINSIAFGNDRFIAVGNNGTILISNDSSATLWTDNSIETNDDFYDVAAGKSSFVVVGNNQCIYQSNNISGSEWKSINDKLDDTFQFLKHFNSITFGNDLFIAIGDDNIIMTYNGESITKESISGCGSLRDIIYYKNTFAIATSKGYIYTSLNNGTYWKRYTNFPHYYNSIAVLPAE